MRDRCVWLCLIIVSAVGVAAQRGGDGAVPGEQVLGTWSGTWDGAGSGGIELTLDKDASGALSGRVSVTGEPTYKAAFRTLSFEGNKMTARYDFPPDEGGEVVLTAAFEGNSAKGIWSAREKATDNELASGNWTVTKKP